MAVGPERKKGNLKFAKDKLRKLIFGLIYDFLLKISFHILKYIFSFQ